MKRGIEVVVVVVLMTISGGKLKTLLVRRDHAQWALPSGAPRLDEALSSAAERVIREQLGEDVEYLEQLYTFGGAVAPEQPRVIEVSYYGLVPSGLIEREHHRDPQRIDWFVEEELPPLLGDHESIVRVARVRLRGKLAYSAVGFELLADTFTLAELQNLYEVILDKTLDKRNFRKKIFELGIVEPTGEERTPPTRRGRPASLFRFKPEVFQSIETKGDIFAF